jgi:hypothetical protein
VPIFTQPNGSSHLQKWHLCDLFSVYSLLVRSQSTVSGSFWGLGFRVLYHVHFRADFESRHMDEDSESSHSF